MQGFSLKISEMRSNISVKGCLALANGHTFSSITSFFVAGSVTPLYKYVYIYAYIQYIFHSRWTVQTMFPD